MKVMFFITFLLLYNIKGAKIEIDCPVGCECDLVENFKRATCVNRNFASLHINMNPIVDILDVSYNQISTLEASVFQLLHLTNLKSFNISHNKLGHGINLDAFNGMTKLKELDMSYCAIGIILPMWFEYMPNLKYLYLEGNQLDAIDPGFVSKSLQHLDLSNCNINKIHPNLFSQLDNLTSLDLSKNVINYFPLSLIEPIKNLNVLHLENNPIECGSEQLKSLTEYANERDISFIGPVCVKKTGRKQMFERIVVDKSLEKNKWIFEEPEKNNTVQIIECNNNTKNPQQEDIVMATIELQPIAIMATVFAFGILVGVVFTCICMPYCFPDGPNLDKLYEMDTLPMRTRRSFPSIRRGFSRSLSVIRRPRDEEDDNWTEDLVQSAWDIGNSTPLQTRKNEYQSYEA